ncbi:hypothetical protein ALI22I_11310 [Saccharothrix sp. ALI-22-I]|uniref:hypothetical protein n=1 Tax=Saccharothrix sp. ALI-22-I TaxID=1933778 RepID=UPI00097C3C0A|nr:hypothetical protein [Saccharothrix sp. ALI-22-I]ONI90699.1 hypothetical protein ALI22I_11310 [Saccharothrix sp. ALI-22-I]
MPDMTLYRGERDNVWPHPAVRLIWGGMTIRDPWPGARLPNQTATGAWCTLSRAISTGGGDLAAFSRTLRTAGVSYGLTFARTPVPVESESDHHYVITIQHARTFLLRYGGVGGWALGDEVPWVTDPTLADQDYVVLNGSGVSRSTVLGYGHFADAPEVTLFTDVPTGWVTSVNGLPIGARGVRVLTDSALSEAERLRLTKLRRP